MTTNTCDSQTEKQMESEKPNLELALQTSSAFFEALDPKMRPLMVQTIRLLAESRPVAPDQIATALQVSREEVTSLLNEFGAELDHEGNVVGLGLSLTPTPHRFQVGDHALFAWCAPDTLIFPALLKQTARIESPDPVTGVKIRLTVTPDKVEKVEPSSAVVSWILCPETANVRGSMCNFQHFFTSPETATKYISQHPGAVILSIDDVHKKIGRFFEEADTLSK